MSFPPAGKEKEREQRNVTRRDATRPRRVVVLDRAEFPYFEPDLLCFFAQKQRTNCKNAAPYRRFHLYHCDNCINACPSRADRRASIFACDEYVCVRVCVHLCMHVCVIYVERRDAKGQRIRKRYNLPEIPTSTTVRPVETSVKVAHACSVRSFAPRDRYKHSNVKTTRSRIGEFLSLLHVVQNPRIAAEPNFMIPFKLISHERRSSAS